MSTTAREAILSSSVSLAGRTLWSGRIELHKDHLSISGWGWTGPFDRHVPIQRIRRVEKWATAKGPNLVIHTDEETLQCQVRGAAFWERELRRDDRIDLMV